MGTKISALTELAASGLASGDYFVVTDTDAATTKKLDADNVLDAIGATAFGKSLIDDANAAALLATIGLDADLLTLSLPASTTISAFMKTVLDDATGIAALTTLGGAAISVWPGALQRPQFSFTDDDTIGISAFHYHHEGTTEQVVYSDALLAFDVGSAGSNAASEDLGADEWHYLYLDDSAIVTAGTNVVAIAQLVNNTTAPTWSETKHGWYNGSDRCIFAFYSDAGSDIDPFEHDGGDYIQFDAEKNIRTLAGPVATDWTTTATFVIPTLCEKVQASFEAFAAGNVGAETFYYRQGDSAGAGHLIGSVSSGAGYVTVMLNAVVVYCTTAGVVDIKATTSEANTQLGIDQNGWYLPRGM